MATALIDVDVDVDVHGSDGAVPDGVVSVHRFGVGRSHAACSCGWLGVRRRLVAAAEQDAWLHSMRERCAVSSPLVLG